MNMKNVNLGFALKVNSAITQLVVEQLKSFKSEGLTLDQVISELSTQASGVTFQTSVPPPVKRGPGRPIGSGKPVAKTAGFITIKELSKLINVSPFTIYGWVASGSVKTHKIEGVKYVTPAEINPFLSSKGLPLVTPNLATSVTR